MHEADLRYPIGPFDFPDRASPPERQERIAAIAALPAELRAAVSGLGPGQWETPYRPGGWTIRQVVHHLPDSHMNAYIRFKLALTEFEPIIKPYHEAAWATLPDTLESPPELSLTLLDALHARWVILLRSFDEEDFLRTLRHPEHGRTFTLDEMLALYAWHGRHHVAHITTLSRREGWSAASPSV
jgi:uncharacterized damage-inducible protein DinB